MSDQAYLLGVGDWVALGVLLDVSQDLVEDRVDECLFVVELVSVVMEALEELIDELGWSEI